MIKVRKLNDQTLRKKKFNRKRVQLFCTLILKVKLIIKRNKSIEKELLSPLTKILIEKGKRKNGLSHHHHRGGHCQPAGFGVI